MTREVGPGQVGTPMTMFNGIPIIGTDFLVAEQANSGGTSASRKFRTSGNSRYSIFVVRFGQPTEGGTFMLWGDPMADIEGVGAIQADEFRGIAHFHFNQLEDFLAGGDRVWSYNQMGLGAPHSLGRIYDIADGKIVA